MLCASFIMRSASASISARTLIAMDRILSASGVGLGLCAHRGAAVGAGVLLGLRADVRRSASRSAACAAAIRSIGLPAPGHFHLRAR
jgi:hypothetical protein